MSTGYKIAEQDQLYFLTLQVVEWVDVFSRKEYRDIIIENLAFCQKKKGLEIYAYVIMSNHLHILAKSGKGGMSKFIHDFKSYTAKQILIRIEEGAESRKEWMLQLFKKAASKHKRNSEYQFWTHENHAEHIFSNKFIDQKLNYIHQNPVRSGIVVKSEDYLYSSARNYAGMDGLLHVEMIEPGVESGGWETGGWSGGGWNTVK